MGRFFLGVLLAFAGYVLFTHHTWDFVRPELETLIAGRWPLRYVGRVRNSSPSEGSAAWHQVNQRALVAQAFEDKADVSDATRVVAKQV